MLGSCNVRRVINDSCTLRPLEFAKQNSSCNYVVLNTRLDKKKKHANETTERFPHQTLKPSTPQERLGIYIKSVVKGGAAHLDGRLQAGDQLLAVDGQSLIGVSQEKAAELMTQTGQMVTLDVAKGGAIYHGPFL